MQLKIRFLTGRSSEIKCIHERFFQSKDQNRIDQDKMRKGLSTLKIDKFVSERKICKRDSLDSG